MEGCVPNKRELSKTDLMRRNEGREAGKQVSEGQVGGYRRVHREGSSWRDRWRRVGPGPHGDEGKNVWEELQSRKHFIYALLLSFIVHYSAKLIPDKGEIWSEGVGTVMTVKRPIKKQRPPTEHVTPTTSRRGDRRGVDRLRCRGGRDRGWMVYGTVVGGTGGGSPLLVFFTEVYHGLRGTRCLSGSTSWYGTLRLSTLPSMVRGKVRIRERS